MWKLIALCILAVLSTTAPACEPSKACALARARELALEHLTADLTGQNQLGWTDMADLIADIFAAAQ